MLPAGLSFNAVSEKARGAAIEARLPRSYWDWEPIIDGQRDRLLALHVGHEPALRPARVARDARRTGLAGGVRAPRPARRGNARGGRGPGASRCCAPTSASTRPRSPRCCCSDEHDADEVRRVILERFDMSLGAGLGKLEGEGLPHRSSRRLQRPDAGRDAVRRGDGPGDRRGPGGARRRCGARAARARAHAGLSRRQRTYRQRGSRRAQGYEDARAESERETGAWRYSCLIVNGPWHRPATAAG